MTDTFFMYGFDVAILASVYFYFTYRNTKKKLAREHSENAQKLFELTVLSELSDKIGYSLSSKDIAETITVTAGKICHVTTVSYAIIQNDHIEIVTTTHDVIGNDYISKVKDLVLMGIYNTDEDLKSLPVSEKARGAHIDPKAQLLGEPLLKKGIMPLSYFNIPLVLNNRFVGVINITSKYPNAYDDEDMSIMYKIVNRAQKAIGRLEDVIETEKDKVESLVKSLNSGEIFFTLKDENLTLFTINNAALRFLNIQENEPDLVRVVSSFNLTPNIVTEMKDVISQKKSTIYRDVPINNWKFNIYVTPVFAHDNDKVIGVAITMQDVTREYEVQKIREGFTNMMVHELRAPLTAIKGAAELLMKPDASEEDRQKMRLIIKNSSERLLEDVGDMLDSAKIDAGKLNIEKVEANINDVIKKEVEELSYVSSSRFISIETHLDDSIPVFNFDPIRVGQVIANLLSNSIKFSEEHTAIEVYSRQIDGKVEVEVRDHGGGIEKDKINSLFKPFAQANFHKRQKGTGLGLYISKAIMSEHDGDIWITSEFGKGTSVFFNLPLIHTTHLPVPGATIAN